MSEQKNSNKLLEVKDLRVSFFTPAGEVKAVGGISYDLNYGERARRLIPLLAFCSPRGRLSAVPLPSKVRMCFPFPKKR